MAEELKTRRINREDMLELTRRMTISRNCFSRVVGAYFDEEGYVDGTFNIHFLKLSKADQGKNLKLAKAIPFADTNRQLKEYVFPETAKKPGSIWQLLMALKECELKHFTKSWERSLTKTGNMDFICFMAAMMCREKATTRQNSGNPKKYIRS